MTILILRSIGLAAIFLLTSTQKSEICPPHFVDIEGGCYFFGTQPATWFESWTQCALMKSTLLSIESFQESYAIFRHIKNLTKQLEYEFTTKGANKQPSENAMSSTSSAYWISGSNFNGKDRWMWFGSGQPIFTSNWCPGQPDNQSGNEHCLKLLVSGNKHCWNDRSCQVRESPNLEVDTYFICETEPVMVKIHR